MNYKHFDRFDKLTKNMEVEEERKSNNGETSKKYDRFDLKAETVMLTVVYTSWYLWVGVDTF